MKRLILVRHGESMWNMENRFTGWTNVELSEKGIKEAKEAGQLLKKEGFMFDIAFSSVLKRANDTLRYILKELNQEDVETIYNYKLNERHYGALQGLNKAETGEKYGSEQLKLWRRSVDTRPPAVDLNDERYPGNDEKYSDIPKEELPCTENLRDTIKRVSDYYNAVMVDKISKSDNVLIVAHGNSLRALIKYLDEISDEEVINLEIPTGKPLCYELDENLKPIKHYYL